MHAEYTIRAARAGVHVLCEKPMAVTVEECERMIDACRDKRRQADDRLSTALRRDQPTADRTGAPRTDRRAEVLQFVVRHDACAPATSGRRRDMGGGTLYDIGVYCINAARYLFRAEPKEVMAISVNSGDPRARARSTNRRAPCCASTANASRRS